MQYINIEDPSIQYTFSDVVNLGVPPDGGSFWPEQLPVLPEDIVERLLPLKLSERAALIMSYFAPELSAETISNICTETFDQSYFHEKKTVVTTSVNPYQHKEYFSFFDRGPTGSIHDFIAGFQIACLNHLGQENTYVLAGPHPEHLRAVAVRTLPQNRWKPIFFSISASGDQFLHRELKALWKRPLGEQQYAVADALRLMLPADSKRGVAAGMLSPEFIDEISEEQKKYGGKYNENSARFHDEQLDQVEEHNDHSYYQRDELASSDLAMDLTDGVEQDFLIYSLTGKSHHTEQVVYNLLSDLDLRSRLAEKGINLTCVDQHGFAAILVEIILLFSAYADLVKMGEVNMGESIRPVLPAPDVDWICAYLACKDCGLPLVDAVVGTNRNQVIKEFLLNGNYNANRRLISSNSPSLDYVYAPNFRRLIYLLNKKDSAKTRELGSKFSSSGKINISPQRAGKHKSLSTQFIVGSVDVKQTVKMLAEYYDTSDYLFDPTTGVLLACVHRYFTRSYRKSLYVVPENPLLFSKILAKIVLPQNNLQGKTYNEILNRLALETSAPIPRAAYTGQNHPEIKKLAVEDVRAEIFELFGENIRLSEVEN